MYQTNSKKKITVIILGVLAMFAAILGAGLLAKSLRKAPAGKVDVPQATVTDENGAILTDGNVHAMPARMLIARASALSEEAQSQPISVKIAANVSPSNAMNQKVDWSLSFVNAESEWSSGKTLSEYVTATPTEDGSLVATVACLQPFGEQIRLTVTSRDNAKATASCLIDYKQQLTDYELSLSQPHTVDNSKKTGKIYADFTSEASLTVNYGYLKSEVYTVPLDDEEIPAPHPFGRIQGLARNRYPNDQSGFVKVPEYYGGGKELYCPERSR